MSWVEDGRALRASVPSAKGLARLGDALGEPVTFVRPLHGGVAAAVDLVTTPTRQLVLKRYRPGDDSAPLEWERLLHAAGATVPTPERVAIDLDGEWFGNPAMVLTFVPGTTVNPPDPELLGRTLALLHTTPVPDPVPAVLLRPPLWASWEQTIEYPPGVVDAIEQLRAVAPSLPTVFAHCDFHPGNVLIEDGVVTAVIDWSSVRLAARGLDVGLARCDLFIEIGGDAPDRLLRAYEDASGVPIDDLPLWDALAAARAIEWGHGWVEAWTNVGVPMTAEQIRARAEAFALAATRSRAAG